MVNEDAVDQTDGDWLTQYQREQEPKVSEIARKEMLIRAILENYASQFADGKIEEAIQTQLHDDTRRTEFRSILQTVHHIITTSKLHTEITDGTYSFVNFDQGEGDDQQRLVWGALEGVGQAELLRLYSLKIQEGIDFTALTL